MANLDPKPALTLPLTLLPSLPPILQVDGLHFSLAQRPLFTDLSLQLPAGVGWVRGGDGRGKTSLLRLLAGVLAADAGALRLNGVHLHSQPAAYRQQVFWRDLHNSADLDAISASAYFATLPAAYPHFNAQILARCVHGLSLQPHTEKPLYMLSTGSKRKVWLAAAFASGAALTLLDDPFAALDQPSIRCVQQLLKNAAQSTNSAMLVAHYDVVANLPLVALVELGD